MVSQSIAMGRSNFLERRAAYTQKPILSSTQLEINQLINTFISEACDWKTLAAMTVGGLAYRAGKLATLKFLPGIAARAVGLALEAITYRSGEALLRGQDLKVAFDPRGLLSTTLDFGLLKGAGKFVQHKNLFLAHALQSGTMVLGHELGANLNLVEREKGTWAQKWINAEIRNIQMIAGMQLVHGVAPGIRTFENELELSVESRKVEKQSLPLLAKALNIQMSAESRDASQPNEISLKDLKNLAVSGDRSALLQLLLEAQTNVLAILHLSDLVRTGHEDAKKGIQSLNVTAYSEAAKTDLEVVNALLILSDMGNPHAKRTLQELDVIALFRIVNEDPRVILYLADIEKLGNRRVRSLFETLDIAALAKAAKTDQFAMNGLFILAQGEYHPGALSELTRLANRDKGALESISYLSGSDPKAFSALVEVASVNVDAFNKLHHLARAGRSHAKEALRLLDVSGFAQAAKVNMTAIAILSTLHHLGNNAASQALQDLDIRVHLAASGESSVHMAFLFRVLQEVDHPWTLQPSPVVERKNPFTKKRGMMPN